MKLLRSAIAALVLALTPVGAFAQQTVLQVGPWVGGHMQMYSGSGGVQPLIQDGGTAGGGAAGANPSELGITARGTGTPPYDAQGHGPNGEIFCAYDAPTTNAAGYHYLCMSPNVGGEGVITYGAGGGAAPQQLVIDVNGSEFPLINPLPIANGGTGQVTANAALNALLPSQAGQNGKVLQSDGTSTSWVAVSGIGTVTSVALALPSEFNVTGSPITAAGTLTGSWANQSANRFMAGPASGAAATPTFRAMVSDDMPTFTSGAGGKVPASGGSIANFMRADGTWTGPSQEIFLEQYGGGTGVANNSAAWASAMAAMPTDGGVLHLLCGTYNFTSNVSVPSYVIIQGCGELGGTLLDFSGVVAAAPAITATQYGIMMRDFAIRGANGPNILLVSGAFGEMTNVKLYQNRSGPCLEITDTFMYYFTMIDAYQCATHGIQIDGFSTSLSFTTAWARENTNSGWYINDTVYSSFNGVASDTNGDYGYILQNVQGVVFNGAGGEANEKGTFLAQASDALAVGQTTPDVKGLVINGGWVGGNGTGAGFYSNFLEANALNGRTVDITVTGGVEYDSINGIAYLMTGTGTVVNQIGGSYIGSRTPSAGARLNVFSLGVSTVAALPACSSGTEGQRASVSNASATTFASIVAGGGANHVPVYCNGTNWIIG